MEKYREIYGDLIKLALDKQFDVIVHGCNCQSIMNAGIAKQMVEKFRTNEYEQELNGPDINKLGNIDYKDFAITESALFNVSYSETNLDGDEYIFSVVNAYTQIKPGKFLDIDALKICLRKMNIIFKGKHIGLPQIGCGIAGGDWKVVKEIIKTELKDCRVSIVIYN